MKSIYDEDYFADSSFTAFFSEGFSVSVYDTLGGIVNAMEYSSLLRKYAHSVPSGLVTHVIRAEESLMEIVPPDERRKPVNICCKILRPKRLVDLLTFNYIDKTDTRYKLLATFKNFQDFKMFCEALREEIDFWYERTS